jgi:hypothetical protein
VVLREWSATPARITLDQLDLSAAIGVGSAFIGASKAFPPHHSPFKRDS